MKKPIISILLTTLFCFLHSDIRSAEQSITQEELLRRTKEMLESVRTGEKSAWEKYFAEDLLFFDERGRNFDKASLLKELGPPPAGYELSFKIQNPKSRITDDVAILSYDIDEDLKIYTQQLGAQFHQTDTWVKRNGEWRIIASQVFRYYGDPAVGDVDRSKFKDYVGTYELAPGVRSRIFVEGNDLYYQRDERPKELLLPEAPQIFFRKGVEGRMLFRFGKDGKVDGLINRRNHEDIVWKKIKE